MRRGRRRSCRHAHRTSNRQTLRRRRARPRSQVTGALRGPDYRPAYAEHADLEVPAACWTGRGQGAHSLSCRATLAPRSVSVPASGAIVDALNEDRVSGAGAADRSGGGLPTAQDIVTATRAPLRQDRIAKFDKMGTKEVPVLQLTLDPYRSGPLLSTKSSAARRAVSLPRCPLVLLEASRQTDRLNGNQAMLFLVAVVYAMGRRRYAPSAVKFPFHSWPQVPDSNALRQE